MLPLRPPSERMSTRHRGERPKKEEPEEEEKKERTKAPPAEKKEAKESAGGGGSSGAEKASSAAPASSHRSKRAKTEHEGSSAPIRDPGDTSWGELPPPPIGVIPQPLLPMRTVAGKNEPGFLDGACARAMLRGPTGIALSPEGCLYVADSDNRRLRKIASKVSPAAAAAAAAAVEAASTRTPPRRRRRRASTS